MALLTLLWACAPGDPYLKLKQQYHDSTYYLGIGEAPLKQTMASTPRIGELMARSALTDGAKESVYRAEWVEGEGEIPLGLDTTFGEAKIQARDAARRNAIEKAMGVYLKSSSLVYNLQLVEDLVTTVARGIIEEEKVLEEKTQEVKHEGQVVGTIFYTKIRAKVRLDRVGHKEFEVKASLNRTSIRSGWGIAEHAGLKC